MTESDVSGSLNTVLSTVVKWKELLVPEVIFLTLIPNDFNGFLSVVS